MLSRIKDTFMPALWVLPVALAVLSFYAQDCFADTKKTASAKPVVKTETKTKPSASAKQPAKSSLSNQDETAKKGFEVFVKDWMVKLGFVSDQNVKHFKLANDQDGYSGRYICYGPECDFEVKPTTSKEAPFIGILRYKEKHFEKRGVTFAEASEAPAVVAMEVPVTEIFRFSKGKWVY